MAFRIRRPDSPPSSGPGQSPPHGGKSLTGHGSRLSRATVARAVDWMVDRAALVLLAWALFWLVIGVWMTRS